MCVQDVGQVGMEWVALPRYMDRSGSLVNAVMNVIGISG
jgi:hypothetical protein